MIPKKEQRLWYHKIKNAIFEFLGDKCVVCGFTDRRALQIDHVNGGGSKERNNKHLVGRSGYKYILDKVVDGSKDYQILCANCNWIKRVVNNENYK